MTLKTALTSLFPPTLLSALLITSGFNVQAEPQVLNSNKYRIQVESIADGLKHPWSMAFLPTAANKDWQLLITERHGNLKLLDSSGAKTQIQGAPQAWQRGEGGLLGLAISPNFNEDKQVFIAYSREQEDGTASTAVARAVLTGDKLTQIETIFTADPGYRGSRQFGGRLLADNNCLWLSVGDRGDKDSAQALNSHSGSLLKIDFNGAPCQDNPDWDQLSSGQVTDARPEIVSYGHKDILGLAKDKQEQIWSHEAGPDRADELNLISAGSNYGWPIVTQGTRFADRRNQASSTLDTQKPVYYWVNAVEPSGLLYYTGDLFPEWQGNLFLGSLKFGKLIRLDLRDGEVFKQERLLKNRYGPIRDVAQGPDGAIFLLTDTSNGHLLRITPAQ